jgi:hypothetical protein
VINYNSVEEAMAARHAIHQARVTAVTGLDHTPAPVAEDTARNLVAATGHTHADITISGCGVDDALVAIGHHDPLTFMAAVHAITDTHDDPFGLLWDGIYSAIYVDELDFADTADWGTEDVWHAHVVVAEHGWYDGTTGTPEPADCLCITHTWAMREVPVGTASAIEITAYRPGAGDQTDCRYADVIGPYRDEDETEGS